MKNRNDEIIYIGKAKNLNKRITSYFYKKTNNGKTQFLVHNIANLETIITDNEVEALILESNLIKKFKPKYNIELKDNNRYPFIKITNEKFPRIVKTRLKKEDKAHYFGPYTSVASINRTIKTITDIFTIRRCSRKLDRKISWTPCLNYHLKKCSSPCSGMIDKNQYQNLVNQVILFLKGQQNHLLTHIKSEMQREAQSQRFENAIVLKERYYALMNLLREQKINTIKGENEDIIGIAQVMDTYNITVLNKRAGKIIGKRDYMVENSIGKKNVLEQFLDLFYGQSTDIPDNILLPFEIESFDALKCYLKKQFNKTVALTVPKKGLKKRLTDLASKNAYQKLEEELYKYNPVNAISILKDTLNLKQEPKCIEAFDVATILGKLSVASMVRFVDGVPDKRGYRRYRIKYINEQNDVEMMKEAVARRCQRLLNENRQLPDLILVDGGKPQVNGVQKILSSLEIENIPIIGLAKREEDIYCYEKNYPITLSKNNEALRLLMAVRNEAHRFANTYHYMLRKREALSTKLKAIPGIGESLINKILTSLAANKTAITIDSLKNIRGIGCKKAGEVYKVLTEINLSSNTY